MRAITATDKAVGTVYDACQEAGYILLITADHGNAEQMLNQETGAPHTAHTTNKVPFIGTLDPKEYKFIEDKPKKEGEEEEEDGALCDVAPTILDIMVSGLFYLVKSRLQLPLFAHCRVFPSLMVSSVLSCDLYGRFR